MADNEDLQIQHDGEIVLPDIRYCPGLNKLDSFNWLKDIPSTYCEEDIVEVRFKNTRKGFYRNVNKLKLETGDIVAVEASPGHDIGRVSLTGPLVYHQLKKLKVQPSAEDLKKVYRKAKPVDIQKWEEAKMLEKPTMLRSRKIAEDLKLDMKIGDVEYQGDKTKAIFYYIADERVDFRQLIKVLAEEFKVRIEMRQIGARQEAGRIGGIGPCGRELCCSTYITNFVSVTTTHAKYQELTLNPQKLAGQCSKLKCCLNFEFDCYAEAQKLYPAKDIPLELAERTVYFQKMEVHKGVYWYSSSPTSPIDFISIPVDMVKEIQSLNKKGIKPEYPVKGAGSSGYMVLEQDLLKHNSLTRFDELQGKDQKPSGKKKKRFNDKKKH